MGDYILKREVGFIFVKFYFKIIGKIDNYFNNAR